jgi:hypothetical protein
VLSVDLERPGAVSLLAAELNARDLEPANVVNNAGFGLVGQAARLDRNEQLGMIDNVRALTELSLAFVDSLARHRGGILNVASLAAFLPGPGMAVYYASKAYVISFSEAIANELKGSGVTVTCLCPGATETAFAARADMEKSRLFKMGRMSSQAVALAGYRAMIKGKRLAIPGIKNKVMAQSVRFAPRKVVTAIARSVQERAE